MVKSARRFLNGQGLMPMALSVVLTAGAGACAQSSGNRDAKSSESFDPWPKTAVAERDFQTAAIVIADSNKPRKLWLMSSPTDGVVQALEFFSGERVTDVQVASIDPVGTGKRLAYRFTDRSGHRYATIRAMPSAVDVEQPASYGGWEDGHGRGHDVVLGATLFERKMVMGADGVPRAANTPVDVRHLFDGQPICETAAYVARTRAPSQQEAESGFKPVAKIISDHDSRRNCWITRPAHAVNLDDNTLLVVTGSKAVRLSGKDLSPVGAVQGIRIIDIRE
ncbi:MAG: hypothetical protein KF800_15610 [Lysobacter sp.]|nr:hypothetical protein [Lysobacter sp.]